MSNTVRLNAAFPNISESDRYWERASGLIPAGTQTLAKGPGQYVFGVAPKYLARGKGARVWDVDGNEFIDYNMGIGPISLGYAYDRVDEAVRRQLESGITFSLMHPLEVEVAELVQSVVPNTESVRFSKTGCDVTSAAIRLARAFTSRDRILCCGYHGWHDWYIATTDRARGIPHDVRNLTYTFEYNDVGALEEALDDSIAAVILEPVVFEPPKDDFLHRLRKLCDRHGVLLIFDEMWTGFRLALGGAQEYFNVRADLACFSKAMANGMPISVLTGRRDVMSLLEQDVFFFTTFGGEALSLAAAKATIEEMRERNVTHALAVRGQQLKQGYNRLAFELDMPYTHCVGMDCRNMVVFDASAGDPLLLKSFVQQEMIRRGILWSAFHNMSYSHTDDDVRYTLDAYADVLRTLRQAVADGTVRDQLRGRPVEPVFRKVSRFNSRPKVQKPAV